MKIELFKWFSLIYLSDMVTMLLALMMIGNFPNTNPMYVEFSNSVIGWMAIKSAIYFIIIMFAKYNKKHNIENILAISCVIYGCLVLYNIHSIYIEPVAYSISPNFTSSLENISYIPKNPALRF